MTITYGCLSSHMKSADSTAPQCCELSFNYFIVLLTGCSSQFTAWVHRVFVYFWAKKSASSQRRHARMAFPQLIYDFTCVTINADGAIFNHFRANSLTVV